MQTTESDRRQIAVAQEYFRRVDAGRADLTDLMTEDVELYFPKFGIGRSKAAFGEFATGVGRVFESVEHDYRTYSFFCSGTTWIRTMSARTRRGFSGGTRGAPGNVKLR